MKLRLALALALASGRVFGGIPYVVNPGGGWTNGVLSGYTYGDYFGNYNFLISSNKYVASFGTIDPDTLNLSFPGYTVNAGGLNVTGNVVGLTFIGNGSGLTNLSASGGPWVATNDSRVLTLGNDVVTT